jgi:hypothetical protein
LQESSPADVIAARRAERPVVMRRGGQVMRWCGVKSCTARLCLLVQTWLARLSAGRVFWVG